jgi:hypothetical protein
MGEQNHDQAGSRLIAREERKLEKLKNKVEASEEKLTNSLAKAIAGNKQALAKDALDATKDGSRKDSWSDKTGEYGIYVDDGEVITGREERVWERE